MYIVGLYICLENRPFRFNLQLSCHPQSILVSYTHILNIHGYYLGTEGCQVFSVHDHNPFMNIHYLSIRTDSSDQFLNLNLLQNSRVQPLVLL